MSYVVLAAILFLVLDGQGGLMWNRWKRWRQWWRPE